MDAQKPKLVLLGSENPTTWIIYNRLVQEFGPFPALVESHVSRFSLLRNRIRNLGLWTVLNQVAFVTLIRPLLNLRSKSRIKRICQSNGLETVRPMSALVRNIENANGQACEEFLRNNPADIIIVNGTRILRPHILSATKATFINTHQGITPKYRGAHGAYWASFESDRGNCGVTVHLVDEGIDTGNIVAQAKIDPQRDDSFPTYAYLQTAAAIPLLLAAIRDIMSGTLKTLATSGKSQVWYHPGFFTYLRGRLRGVR